VNEAEATEKAQAEAREMGAHEIRFAKEVALSAAAPANQRILALYLLSLAGSGANGALREIALAPLPAGGEVHSHEEHQLMQAKAERRMAIDALVDRIGRGESTARDLTLLAEEMRDPGLRGYIQRKLRDIR
jgi:hypothetical protein